MHFCFCPPPPPPPAFVDNRQRDTRGCPASLFNCSCRMSIPNENNPGWSNTFFPNIKQWVVNNHYCVWIMANQAAGQLSLSVSSHGNNMETFDPVPLKYATWKGPLSNQFLVSFSQAVRCSLFNQFMEGFSFNRDILWSNLRRPQCDRCKGHGSDCCWGVSLIEMFVCIDVMSAWYQFQTMANVEEKNNQTLDVTFN